MRMEKRFTLAMLHSVFLGTLTLLCMLFFSAAHAQPDLVTESKTTVAPEMLVAIYNQDDSSIAKRTIDDLIVAFDEHDILSVRFSDLSSLTDASLPISKVLAIGNDACEDLVSIAFNYEIICGVVNHFYRPGDISLGIDYLPLEVPALEFFKLAKLLTPKAETIGILLGPSSHHRQSFYTSLANYAGMKSEFASIDLQSNPVMDLDPAMRKSQVFMVLPDQLEFNRAVAPWVLQLSLRYRMPLLAYSFNYANAGALVSLYQSREDVVENILNHIKEIKKPLKYSIRINYAVAKNLGLELLEEKEYLAMLRGGGE